MYWPLLNSDFGPLFFIVLIVLNNLWWTVALILPAYVKYPEILGEKLWKIPVSAFLLTVVFRYSLDYLVSLTPLAGFSYFSHTIGDIYLLQMVVIIPVTTGIAFLSYWMIMGIIKHFPKVRRCLSE
jgi:hypothetical protein